MPWLPILSLASCPFMVLILFQVNNDVFLFYFAEFCVIIISLDFCFRFRVILSNELQNPPKFTHTHTHTTMDDHKNGVINDASYCFVYYNGHGKRPLTPTKKTPVCLVKTEPQRKSVVVLKSQF